MSNFPYRVQIRHFWDVAVVPPLSIQEPIHRHRAQFLNTLLVSYLPLSLLILIIQILMNPTFNLAEDTSTKSVIMGVVIVLIIYSVNRTAYYRLANYFAVGIGFLAIGVNAVASQTPHIEIVYLIVLPLAGILLLSVTENVVVCLLTIACLILFAQVMGDIPEDIYKDLITFCIIVEAMIVFASRQRNQLEVDRQRQVIENEKIRILAQFIRDVSHEFRTPLSIMNSGLYLIGKTVDPQAQQQRITLMQNQITYLAKLLDDMIIMTRLDSRTALASNRLAVDDLVRDIVTSKKGEVAAKGLTIELTLQPNLPMIQGDQAELQMAFTHLLRNAIQYTSQGSIAVKIFRQQTSTVVEIKDTGIGIAEMDQDRIFERFYQVDEARSTIGAGLGLAIAKKVIEDHHGKIEVESVLGEGSLFRVTLPPTMNISK